MYLIKNGIPFDVAFGCSPAFTMAAGVTLAKFDGHDFDWHALRFKEKPRQ